MAREELRTQNADQEEVEILEFNLGTQAFGVNVLKIEAIEQYDARRITTIPMSPPHVVGTLLFRRRTIPLIDLGADLGIVRPSQVVPLDSEDDETAEDEAVDENAGRVFLVTNFNNITIAFVADGVNRIHRVTWRDINPMDAMFEGNSSSFTGSFNIEGREILIVDMEQQIAEIDPRAAMDVTSRADIDHPQAEERPNVKILLAEDSGTMRSLITGVLEKGGYTNVTTFTNGQAAHDAVLKLKERATADGTSVEDMISLVITDIEMPQMSGLSLCRAVKQQMGLSHLPVIIFSTQINDDMVQQCKLVGADGWISKPQVTQLVHLIDRLALERQPA
ncbi:MAG: response regulator [Planctomycetes bacterium]|nr:chemotaxis protein CheV [Phycisphaerae bacterium]NBB95823.1 response regulator [Planctomycetota bacterium]